MDVTWFPVTYGRTLHLDFRMLAVPSVCGEEERAFIERTCGLATRHADNMRERHRVAMASEDGNLLFGVACLIRDAVGDEAIVMAGDRRNYLFAGYWCRMQGDPRLPALSELVPSFALPHCEHVRTLWETHRRNEQIATEGSPSSWVSADSAGLGLSPGFGLNSNRDLANVWQDSQEQREILWNSARRALAKGGSPTMALYLGLNSRRDVTTPYPGQSRSSVFNATIQHKDNPGQETIAMERPPEEPKDREAQISRELSLSRRDRSPSPEVWISRILLVGGALITLFSWVIKSSKGLVTGGAIVVGGVAVTLIHKASHSVSVPDAAYRYDRTNEPRGARGVRREILPPGGPSHNPGVSGVDAEDELWH